MIFASFNLAISPIAYAYSESEAEELKEKVQQLGAELLSSVQGENGHLNVAQIEGLLRKLQASLPAIELWINEQGTQQEKEEFQEKVAQLRSLLATLRQDEESEKKGPSLFENLFGGSKATSALESGSDIESGTLCNEGSSSLRERDLSSNLAAFCPLLPTEKQAAEFQALLVSTSSDVASSLDVTELIKEMKNECERGDDPSGEGVTISISIPCIICLLIIAFGIYSAVVLLAFPKSGANIYK